VQRAARKGDNMAELARILEDSQDQAPTAKSRLPERLYALKDGDAFAVFDACGDMSGSADGFFLNDTRLLSRFRFTLFGHAPPLLSAAVGSDNVWFTSHGTNRPLAPIGEVGIPEGIVHFERKRFLSNARIYERLRCTNYGHTTVELPLCFSYDADFFDMFEVRGLTRSRRGQRLKPILAEKCVEFQYRGLDDIVRRSVISFSETPNSLTESQACFKIRVAPGRQSDVFIEIGAQADAPPSEKKFYEAGVQARAPMREKLRRGARVSTSGPLFDTWLAKSRADLALLVSDLTTGPYPYAGIPWFSTTFGRDALITAWQVLWLDPGLARGVLSFLAANQAREHSSFRDAAPGKILHEARRGEMAMRGEVPFERYYGGVDTTCLFVALAAAYADRTGDMEFVERLWSSLLAAINWMDSFAQSNADGLITYERGATSGLLNQGWKDSHDSIFHADGCMPEGPIALVEVQGYAFAAYSGMAGLAQRRGDGIASELWRARAEQLRLAVEKRFWMEETQFYGIAIDGEGKLCRVRASNAGHLLFVGLPSIERGRSVARQLAGSDFATGWGLRTLASDQIRYNPMSYHNGSVWPHDTALCVAGLRRYGEIDVASKLLSGMFEAASHFDMRLPELFCGFPRAGAESPVAYPVACLPQAWAAASTFGMLQACLGVTIDGWNREIRVIIPRLPTGLGDVEILDIDVGQRKVGLSFQEIGGSISVLRIPGNEPPVPVITQI
jgi:glycogen debranching enzyme